MINKTNLLDSPLELAAYNYKSIELSVPKGTIDLQLDYHTDTYMGKLSIQQTNKRDRNNKLFTKLSLVNDELPIQSIMIGVIVTDISVTIISDSPITIYGIFAIKSVATPISISGPKAIGVIAQDFSYKGGTTHIRVGNTTYITTRQDFGEGDYYYTLDSEHEVATTASSTQIREHVGLVSASHFNWSIGLAITAKTIYTTKVALNCFYSPTKKQVELERHIANGNIPSSR